MNHYIGRNTITLGRCGSETCTTHLVQKVLGRETNIKIVPELIKFVNLLKNMGGKIPPGNAYTIQGYNITFMEDNSHLR